MTQMAIPAIDAELRSLQLTIEAVRGSDTDNLFVKLRTLREQQDRWLDLRIDAKKRINAWKPLPT